MNKLSEKFVVTTFIGVALFFFLFPLFWMVLMGFKNHAQAFSNPPLFIFTPTLENFIFGFETLGWGNNLKNSLIVATLTTFISLLLGVPCAYGFARFKIFGDKHLRFWILSIVMMPPVVAVIPVFTIWAKLGLIDTYLGLAMAHTIFNLPLVIWLMIGFLKDVPHEIEEAAEIDGCNKIQKLLFISLPVAKSGLATVTTLSFILSWNELLFASILTQRKTQTLPPAIGALWKDFGLLWGQIGAITLIASVPVLIIGFFLQKHLVRGLTLGAVKE
ncbi:MAG: carbohydrate ABC transporter permease [Alphaproteobacteria bacterium]|nr:carbohydrate ABC transporter permease [Alphaproteobacteria bacterium]